jgi:hypothetical protein
MATIQLVSDWDAASDEVWVVLKEPDRISWESAEEFAEIKAYQKRTTRRIKKAALRMRKTALRMRETAERMKQTALQMRETIARIKESAERTNEIDRWTNEIEKLVWKFGGSFDQMLDDMIIPNLLVKFDELNLTFDKISKYTRIEDSEHNIFTKVDVILDDGETEMVVETKIKPEKNDIDEHIERMEKVRKYADLYGYERKYLGAMVGIIFCDDEKTYALQNGFYVVEAYEGKFSITVPTPAPREW